MTEDRSPWTDLLGLPLPVIADLDPDDVEFIVDDIAVVVIGGGGVHEADAGFFAEMLEDEGVDAATAKAEVATLVGQAIAAQAALAAAHPDRTDRQRLDAAFAEMEAKGIVARHDLGMTLSDGEADIDEIVDAKIAAGETVRGNLFYHRQDLTRAVLGGGLNLAYTGDRTGRDAAKAIGNEVRAILRTHGFKVAWNGNPDARLEVDFSPALR